MSDYFDRVEQRILRSVQAQSRRPRWRRARFDLLVPAISIAVAVVITVVFLSVRGGSSTLRPNSVGSGRAVLVYRAEPTAQSRVDRSSLNRAITVMRGRVRSLGITGATFQILGGDSIKVTLPNVANLALAEQQLGTSAHLDFYDWEANALVPGISHPAPTVASQLQRGNGAAETISQGSATPPGSSSTLAGGLGLYEAVKLAAAQPARPSQQNARFANQYWLFGAPGSQVCKTAAATNGTKPIPGVHCLLDEPPVQEPVGTPAKTVDAAIQAALPPGVRPSQGQELVVQPGTVVLQGSPSSFSTNKWPKYGSPLAKYFVLRDSVAVFGDEITNPQQGTDATGAPNVQFGFTSKGGTAFQKLTAQIATRGSLLNQQQHFAVALDQQLLSVPYIDYKQYPDGIGGSGGADISGNFTIASARALATELLPINLQLIRVLYHAG